MPLGAQAGLNSIYRAKKYRQAGSGLSAVSKLCVCVLTEKFILTAKPNVQSPSTSLLQLFYTNVNCLFIRFCDGLHPLAPDEDDDDVMNCRDHHVSESSLLLLRLPAARFVKY